MAISYPLALPATKSPVRVSISAKTAVTISSSPASYIQQVQRFNGQMWLAEVTLPPMERADAEQWIAWLLKLNGQEGTFLLGDGAAKTPRGTVLGTPLINGALAARATSIVTDGWTAGATIKAGDYIQLGQRLYKNLSDATASGGGAATLDIWPYIRETVADNASVITSSCVGLFRLADSNYQIHSANADKIFSLSFSAMEAI